MAPPAYILGADLSHYQKRPDMGELWDAGVRYIIPKATESMAVDPDFDWIVNAAVKKGMVVPACYAFVRSSDGVATVNNFLKVANGLPLAIDDEAAGVSQAVVDMWAKGYEDATGREGLGYYGLFPNAAISALFERWPRWFPQYPGSDLAPSCLPAWDGSAPIDDWRSRWLIWQYTGTSRIAGLGGTFDLNRLAPTCSLDMLAAWAKTGAGTWDGSAPPTPPPSDTAPPSDLQTAEPLLGSRPLFLHATGDDVEELQTLLAKYGANPLTIDGIYGPETRNAVFWFQRNRGNLTVDGWAGPETIGALISAAK